MIYSYDGRAISNPKIPGVKYDQLNKRRISVSQDILAVLDSSNPKVLKLYDIMNGKPTGNQIEHTNEIIDFELNNSDMSSERKIAFLDTNRDLFIIPALKKDVRKLVSMCDSFKWHDKYDMLSAAADLRVHSWYYPNAIYVDKDLIDMCKMTKDAPEIGRDCTVTSFSGSILMITKKNGTQVIINTSPYPSMLLQYCDNNDWEKAIKLCRYIKDKSLWAFVAAISLHHRNTETAEISLANIESIEKVQYITQTMALPSEVSRQAALLLYFRKYEEAEQLFLQDKLYYRSIKMNIK